VRKIVTLPLFAPEPLPAAAQLRGRLEGLAREGVWIGGSSWKYEGWLGQIYERERYLVRGRFSQRKFEQECLAEYATVFPAVCGDFSFYQFPAAALWQKLFADAPPPFRFSLKVPEEITVKQWPRHARYGVRGGAENENFLNAELLRTAFLDALTPYRGRIGVLIFEFGAFASLGELTFLARLERFVRDLPPGFRYAVEIRNPEFLGTAYFSVLAEAGIAHVFNAWTRMPELSAQIRMPGAFTAGFTAVRALLRQGRPYERAVELFAPYSHVQDPNPEGRDAIRNIIRRARREQQPSYIFINNRFEGNAPQTMLAILEEIED
jgi:uncharacterized protein YecE (DUF72 family)